jgi:hypothetical protein
MKVNKLNAAFEGFTSTEVTSEVLKAGEHEVRLMSFAAIHSKVHSNGEVKDKEYDYTDVTAQLYCVFGSTNNTGAIAHRFNLEAFKKYDDLETEVKERDDIVCSNEGWALKLDKNGENPERIADKAKTIGAHNILSQAMNAMGLPAGSGINDLATVRDEKKTFRISVVKKEYNDKEYFEVKRVMPVKVGADVGAEAFE